MQILCCNISLLLILPAEFKKKPPRARVREILLQHKNPAIPSHGLHPASAEIRCAFFVYCCLHVLLFVLHVNAHARVRLFIDRSLWSIRSLIFVFLSSAECSTGVVGAACIHRPSALLRCPQRHWRSQACPAPLPSRDVSLLLEKLHELPIYHERLRTPISPPSNHNPAPLLRFRLERRTYALSWCDECHC